MTDDEFVSITRGLVTRGWTDIEPKIAASFASGGVFGILVTILASYHVPITPAVQEWGPYIVAVLGGYIFPSSGHIITTKSSPDATTTTTKTSGSVETIVKTGSIPIQRSPQAAAPQSFTQTVEGTSDPNAPTQVMPSSDRVADFMKNLPPSSPLATPPASTPSDGH